MKLRTKFSLILLVGVFLHGKGRSDTVAFDEVGDTAGNIELAIAGLMPVYTDGGWSAAGVVPAIEMAVSDVNSRFDVLPGYKLKLYLKDDHCNPGYATSLLFEHLMTSPTKLMILGSGCSIASVPVANAAPYYNLLQSSFSTSGELGDDDRFPYFYRVVQSDLGLNPPYLAILRHFEWKRVAVLYHDILFFAMGKDSLLEILKKDGVDVVVSESFNDYPVHQLESIKKNDVRIILVMGYEDKTRKAFCEIRSSLKDIYLTPTSTMLGKERGSLRHFDVTEAICR
uniref:Gamma-aminobutyric acid type B receptor subunit 1-like n=1 Tax=Saccoglossus kowalevskii TaxID=10224 RepID=A0ABM0M2W3_SACKO|nr:PREDICTED: gamma-aminobutyric acid type B receptor subunit 1-like [Saccoglossus kowalevskii]